ncbi:hypothetical protein GCM10017562_72180 [Streptomyces roseofulvus]|uniref:hypothetical protein n=1 Tax=Streptomyces roseofulvus TaxID=33902 RepID=UPI0031FD86F4
MNRLNDERLRTWTLRWMALLAADSQDQRAWLGDRDLDTASVVEEVELVCRISAGLAERAVLASEDTRDLQELGRHLAALTPDRRAGLWAESLVTDRTWTEVRTLARRILHRTTGDWRRPLPDPAGAPHPPTAAPPS